MKTTVSFIIELKKILAHTDNKSTTLERRKKKFKCNAEEKTSSAMS